jgi:hypothetical protein
MPNVLAEPRNYQSGLVATLAIDRERHSHVRYIYHMLATLFAERTGVAPAYVLSLKGRDTQRTRSKTWQTANGCRYMAVYLLHTHFCVPYADIEAVTDIQRGHISRIVQTVEDERENPRFQRYLSLIESILNG